jgi:hypothetical protein
MGDRGYRRPARTGRSGVTSHDADIVNERALDTHMTLLRRADLFGVLNGPRLLDASHAGRSNGRAGPVGRTPVDDRRGADAR